MRSIVLVARKSPEICLRATKNFPVFTRQLCKLCCSLSQNSVSTKAWYSQDIGRSHDRHDRRRPHSHTIEEEVKILAHTHSDIGWVSVRFSLCCVPGPNCSKLTTSLGNSSCIAKASLLFSTKSISVFGNKVKCNTLNKLTS